MSLSIGAALDQIIAIQKSLAITTPTALTVKKAFRTVPRQEGNLPDLPAFINVVGQGRETRGPTGQRTHTYDVHMQLFIGNADTDVGADIALAFHDQVLAAFDGHVTLSGTCTLQSLRWDQLLTDMVWANRSFGVGLDYHMDVVMGPEAATVGA